MEALREQITGVSAILGVPVPDGLEGMAVAATGAAATSAPASQPATPTWVTVIIRGGKIETKQFALPNAETQANGGE
ncbi:MAG: hypothetical protein IIA44_09560 [Acidobacteria bacterium]|nr:hypothetical protein [Acidobacteriota bacterium]